MNGSVAKAPTLGMPHTRCDRFTRCRSATRVRLDHHPLSFRHAPSSPIPEHQDYR